MIQFKNSLNTYSKQKVSLMKKLLKESPIFNNYDKLLT